MPLFLVLANAIIAEIERGRLKPGDRLPGTRRLATQLKLHRNTIDAAFHELSMQGWLYTKPARGTFVATDLPQAPIGSHSPRPSKTPPIQAPVTSHHPKESVQAGQILVNDGQPDPRLLPRQALGRAFRQALNQPDFLSPSRASDPRGAFRLRRLLAENLQRTRGLSLDPDQVLLTRGSQMALYLAARAILTTGDAIAVEDPGYPLARAAFIAAGARVIRVPVDDHGLNLEALGRIIAQEPRLRAVYVTPHHQYPTTVTLGAARRLRLLDLAKAHNLTLIEDDYDHEYRFEGRPILPLAARARPDQPLIYIGSLSKVLSPMVRQGFGIAPPPC